MPIQQNMMVVGVVSEATPTTAANERQPKFFAITSAQLRDPNYDMRPLMLWLMQYGSEPLKAHVATLLPAHPQNTLNAALTQEPVV